jgi:hypothetical protein
MSKSGIILIVLGVLFLAHNLGVLPFSWLRDWWPLILIGVGVWSLLTHHARRRDKSCGPDKTQP